MNAMTALSLQQDLDVVAAIEAVPRILEVICRSTGMGFAAVARVTEDRWVCCSVRDEIGFGLQPGSELKLETTICNEIRQSGRAVVIDHVAEDQAFCRHPTPAMYGFQSYISVPITRAGGGFWGTLCAIDPRPRALDTSAVRGMFALFAELISFQLEAHQRVRTSESALLDARAAGQLREQFIAVLGHDLRSPLQTLGMGTTVLAKQPEKASAVLPMMQRSVQRMAELVDNVMDFARGRLGGGLELSPGRQEDLGALLRHVVAEQEAVSPQRMLTCVLDLPVAVVCDGPRVAQLLSNLLANALKYGDPALPVRVRAQSGAAGLELSVANGGKAIPPEVVERLFEPYFRGANHGGHEGLGLGLYIVTEIARAHGGTMEVVSDDTETRFTFRLPQQPQSPVNSTAPASP
jgi:signal transduction histidine kinase